MSGIIDATIGRSLLVRIWAHGVLLFVGVIAMVLIARWWMTDLDESHTMRAHPYIAAGLAERVLAHSDRPDVLATELARFDAETPASISVFAPSGALLASSVEPPLRAPTAAEIANAARREPATWTDGRLVVARVGAGAIAVVGIPPGPSVPLHVLALIGSALLLAFVFVALPLTRSIARPIARLDALARELGDGNLAVRANTDRHDEIGDLGRTFDAMALQLQRLRAAERELLGSVSHELRTPLARMRVVLELASDVELDRARHYLAEVATDLTELEHMLDDIIVSARLDASTRWDEARPPLRRERITSDALTDAAVAKFRASWPDRVLEVERPATPVEVEGDLPMLRRALDNLLDNARKYSDMAITLRVAHEGQRVTFEVIDRGIGIDVQDHERVFSPFFRADRSRTRASGGVGLGLVVARRIVEAHGGGIGFESERDRGSRFWFAIDVAGAA
jgi:two-component system, OmpR family, sensor kinase